MTRYDLVSPRKKKDGSTHWHKVGAAFSRDQGGFTLMFDSLPLPDETGKVAVLMSEPRQQHSSASQSQQHPNSGAGGYQAPPTGAPSPTRY